MTATLTPTTSKTLFGNGPLLPRRPLGTTGLEVPILAYGASSLGGVYGPIDENRGIRAVLTALDCGLDFIDVSPAYGGTLAETVLGRALAGVPRDRYLLSTKVGKNTPIGGYGGDRFDYTEKAIRASVEASLDRLGVDHLDFLILHDIEYEGRRHVETALGEGLETLKALKEEGVTRFIGASTYPMAVWRRILEADGIDVILTHNHYALCDTQLLSLLDVCRGKGIGVINSSPLACGLLTEKGPPAWHPASAMDRARVHHAAELCRARGTTLEQLAISFAVNHPDIPTTLTTSSSPERLLASIQAARTALDTGLVDEVRHLLGPMVNRDWAFAENVS